MTDREPHSRTKLLTRERFSPAQLPTLRRRGPRIGCAFHGFVVGVQFRAHQQDGGDTPGNVGDCARLVRRQAASEDVALAIAEPFFDYLVAADRVFPYADRNVLQ